MKSKNSTLAKLETPFQSIARAMSEKYDVKIVSTGAELSTDGTVIKFPWNADKIKKIPFAVLNGYLDHEVGHIREERRHKENAKITPIALMNAEKNTTIRMLMNVFEDVRMERIYSEEFLGVAENLRAAMAFDVEELRQKIASKKDPGGFWHLIGCGIISKAINDPVEYLGPDILPYLDLCNDEIEESKSTIWGSESLKLAKRTYEKLKKHAKEEIKKSEKAEKGKEEIDKPETGEGEEGESGGGKFDDLKVSKAQLDVAKSAFEDATITHLMDVGREKINSEAVSELKSADSYVPAPECQEKDRWFSAPRGDIGKYFDLKERVAGQTKSLRTKLKRRLKAVTDDRDVYDLEEGVLDFTSLSQLRVGEKRIFGKTVKGLKVDTAVSILVDRSGSMGWSGRMEMAQLACISISEALSDIEIPFEVIAFDNQTRLGIGGFFSYTRSGFVNRSPFAFEIYKAFNEKFRKIRDRFSKMNAGQDNADGEAVMAVALRLARRPEPRKILIVLSDGEPACTGLPYEKGIFSLNESIKRITSAGIEVVGIGIQTESVLGFYSKTNGAKSVVVEDIDQLATKLFKVVSAQILSGLKKGKGLYAR